MDFRLLKPEEIEVKTGSVTKNGYTLLLYKNARVDMAILDETVGAEHWQRDHKEVKGNLYCGIGIRVMEATWEPYTSTENGVTRNDIYHSIKGYEPEWVWKWDCGVESAFGDKEKGEASDSFKRAGFNWGIGRELYTSPFIFINCETTYDGIKRAYQIPDAEKKRIAGFRVKDIKYNANREIESITIVDSKGVVVFGKGQPKEPKEEEQLQGGDYIFQGGKYLGKKISEVPKNYLDWCLSLGSPEANQTLKANIKEYYRENAFEVDI